MTRYLFLWSLFFATVLYGGDMTSGGFARTNITPDKPVTLSGYESRKGLSEGIHDSLYARCCIFQSGDEKAVFISTDIIGFYGETADYFREALTKRFDLGPSQLFLCAIHTHAGPRVTLDRENGHPNNVAYSMELESKLIDLVDTAMDDLTPVTFQAGTGSSPVGVNRREVYYDHLGNPRMWIGRNPGGPMDRQVQVICARARNGARKAVMWDYAVHSTCLGFDNYIISGDVHGLAERFIEEYLGAGVIAPAFVGASGDIDPWYRVLPKIETQNGWIPEPVLLGTLLGEEVVHVLREMEDPVQSSPLFTHSETIILPGKPRGKLEAREDSPQRSMEITVARIGSTAFVGFGGELLSEIGLRIKQASPFAHTMVITHCNGSAGYLSPRHIYHELGYEILTSPFASGAAEIVIKRTLEILNKLYFME